MPVLFPGASARRSNVEEDFVFCFDEAAGVLLSSYVPQFLVPRECREERDAPSDQYRYSCDREPLNETGTQETLDRNSTIDIGVLKSAGRQPRDDIFGGSGHLFDTGSSQSRKIERVAAEHNDLRVAVGPFGKSEDRLKCLAAEDDYIDGRNEFAVAVGFTAALRQEIQIAIGTGDKAINAGTDEYRGVHGRENRGP